MTTESADLTPGGRLRAARRRRGLTVEAAAALVGRSVGWLKKIESGERGLPRVAELVRLCEVLRVGDLAEITGDTSTKTLTALGRPTNDTLPPIRTALTAYRIGADDEGTTEPLDSLRSRVASAWHVWHTSAAQRTDVGRLLPGLLTDAQRASAAGRPEALVILADVYHLAQQMLASWAEPELVWVAADRGMATAQASGDPLAISSAAWCVGNMLRAVGRMEEATDLVLDASASIADDVRPEARTMRGALFAHASVSAAKEYSYGDAWRYWDQAGQAITGIGDYTHPWTVFGTTNLAIHAVSIEVDSGRHREAAERFDRLEVSGVPSRERQARALVEGVRAHTAGGSDLAALHLLQRAEKISFESLQYTAPVRSIVPKLVARAGASTRDEFAELAGRLAVAA
ncbi:helix-turn-helix transcriptional regulator [Dactylosporangium sp. NPDC005555]|uniref:helix-turn-helix domain-containing protein n=1 Tax=Dactylosporangium sp. NPDC005555 TaxID=3154889 RepID=UPI0033B37D2E